MRILHTSDWHLGRQFFQLPLDEDHDVILAQVHDAISAHSPDVLIIAGDIFDRAGPPQTALARLRDFLVRATANPGLAIVIIAGNHDAAAQIAMLGVLAPSEKALSAARQSDGYGDRRRRGLDARAACKRSS